ncbi:hypothetical protein ACIBG4_16065 [Nonomuraea sp. NPDC050383]|uniref:hypothetical protein n=1 Tax=Nonomuraea sp. NPDC050383 TaxID=3364362 RepID=UPI00379FB97B
MELHIDVALFQGGDAGFELVDVVASADPGLAADLLAEGLAEAFLQLADLCGEAGVAGVGGQQVGLERGAGDGRASAACGGGRLGRVGVDLGSWSYPAGNSR